MTEKNYNCIDDALTHIMCFFLFFFLVWLQKNYENFDGFVILHGTDTMAYTASALSFMCEHLGKPVILTGSQVRAAVRQGPFKQKDKMWKDKKPLLPSQDETRSVFRCLSMSWGMMAETTCWGRCWSLASLSFLRWGNGDCTRSTCFSPTWDY